MSRKYTFTLLVFVLWIVGIYFITSLLGGDLPNTISKISLRHFFTGYLFYICAVIAGVWVLYRSLICVRLKPRVFVVARAWIFGSFLDNIVPTITPAGEASMAYFLNKFYNISYTKSLAAIGLYVSAWGISATIFSALALLIINYSISIPSTLIAISAFIVVLFALLTIGWLLLITKKDLVEKIVCKIVFFYNKVYNKFKKRKITYDICVFRSEFDKSYSSLELVLRNKVHIFVSVIAFFIPQLCHALTLYSILLGFGIQLPFLAVLFVHIIASVSGLLAFIPSGLGVYEASSAGILTQIFSVDGNIAIASVFLYRLVFVWTTNLVGGFVGLKHGVK
ncbi:MAG: flippase-like domain-containing protein [Candidatus Altiarchaeota archaeon]|nr:flippase-like domain-containing protein [Candidatus Altiarchaeota archaeon]